MSLRLPQAPNAGLFKQGYSSYSNADGAVLKNIEACREISKMVLTSIGPCGRNKIVVNHLQKVFITNDAATMLNELDVVHPAVKILVMASQQQELEMGDGTNFVLVLAGELLSVSEKLLSLGLKPTEVIQGYQLASKFALEELDKLTIDTVEDLLSLDQLKKVIKPVISSKQYGSEDFISELVAEAILNVIPPKNPKAFNVDSVRVVKIMGSSLENSQVIKGMVFPREPEGLVKNLKEKSKVAVYTCPIDTSQTETKGTVLLHNAKEMLDFSKGEEAQVDQIVKEIFNSGVKVVVAGSGIGELAQHYLDRYGILALKVPSKFDLRRISRVCGATPLPRLGAPTPEEAGSIDIIETKEIGGDRVTIFRQENDITRTSTIIVRGATKNNLEDIERAIDDGVSAVKGLTKDGRLLPGAGAVETELVNRITQYGEKTPGLLQLAIKQYANAFEVIPRVLAETSGLDPSEVLPRLYSKHSKEDGLSYGIDVDSDSSNGVKDIKEDGIYDLLSSKKFAINAATEAATTVLSVDQIIMAKRAGGPQIPKQPRPGNWDQED